MRMPTLRATAAAVFVGLGVIVGAGAVTAGDADASWRYPGQGDLIIFDVYSDTTWATVSFYNHTNHLEQRHFNFRQSERLPDGRYHRKISFRSAVPQQILAVKLQQEGKKATCKLSVNHKLKIKRTGYGERASALCAMRNDRPPRPLS
ncbi:hypothetical protein GOARA_056_01320 [Gordonia araii NBRC 100433]|uniref:Uncharacterized protein n=1 Tax=Gordonia araii NBRC 100433 TaxID=1073574 RepID=G7H3F9_9ACTN|nr:hypothetical protein [Gordonia araii]NNG96502.1 hypothetical protein [Gordonia araii NBRC 100433]GAB10384.1 hypothetical protein GOARA_056_01320 [Gordonia araii NBRC 100433]